MEWADELAARVSGPQVVNDSKTPSGTVHVGSLRGPVIVDTIARALRANGLETTYLYGVDDLDPMDAQALLTPDAIERFMGVPLAHVPDPAGDCHPSYARHFAGVFVDNGEIQIQQILLDGVKIRHPLFLCITMESPSGSAS